MAASPGGGAVYLTVFVEPGPAGFRATCTSPLPLTADALTADAAVVQSP